MPAHRLVDTDLFKLLRRRELHDGYEAAEVSSQVAGVIGYAWPIVQQVVRHFPNYTLHDPDHAFRVAQHMAALIPPATLSELNSIELSILLYSAYLHDIGMAASQEELIDWLNSESYRDFLDSHFEWAETVHRLEQVIETSAPESEQPDTSTGLAGKASAITTLRCVQDVLFTEYLRQDHAERGSKFIRSHFGSHGKSRRRIEVGEVNYADQVAIVCESHTLDTRHLKDSKYRRDLYITRFPANLQFCAILLRLADLLDLDPERTPHSLLDFLHLDLKYPDRFTDASLTGERARSAAEWHKHRSVIGWKVTPEEIRVEARCSHPAIQHGLLQWCSTIEQERRECRLLAADNRKEITEKYDLDLNVDVRADYIESDGSYLYSDLRFSLDYEHIVTLLMGRELWGQTYFAIRELLQNAVDSCHHRAAVSNRLGVEYEPRIRFETPHWDGARDPQGFFVLACEDNGMGMDQEIVERYLVPVQQRPVSGVGVL